MVSVFLKQKPWSSDSKVSPLQWTLTLYNDEDDILEMKTILQVQMNVSEDAKYFADDKY